MFGPNEADRSLLFESGNPKSCRGTSLDVFKVAFLNQALIVMTFDRLSPEIEIDCRGNSYAIQQHKSSPRPLLYLLRSSRLQMDSINWPAELVLRRARQRIQHSTITTTNATSNGWLAGRIVPALRETLSGNPPSLLRTETTTVARRREDDSDGQYNCQVVIMSNIIRNDLGLERMPLFKE